MDKKRRYKVIIFAVILVSGVMCLSRLNTSAKIQGFKEISVDDVKMSISKKENLIVYYGQASCSACRVFTPTLKEAAEFTDKEIYFLDGDNLETKGFSKEYNIQGTPAVLIIHEGSVTRYEGIYELEEIIKILSEI